MSKDRVKEVENWVAEINEYTNYCKLIDYQIDAARTYMQKKAAQAVRKINLGIAQFPYGVGPMIMAAKAAVKQVQDEVEEVQDEIEVMVAIAQKLSELKLIRSCPPIQFL